jgi:hypothetical protein
MNIVAFARVSNIAEKYEHGKDAKGRTDYDTKLYYFESTLEILENTKGVEGHVTVRENLQFGKFYRVAVNTENPVDVILDQVVSGDAV